MTKVTDVARHQLDQLDGGPRTTVLETCNALDPTCDMRLHLPDVYDAHARQASDGTWVIYRNTNPNLIVLTLIGRDQIQQLTNHNPLLPQICTWQQKLLLAAAAQLDAADHR